MRHVATAFCLAVASLAATSACAADDASAIEGTYLILQQDGHQRALSFDRSGNVVMVSDLETVVGFTSGVGSWEQTGPGEAAARIVNFNFNVVDGKQMGAAIASYTLSFADEVSGKYRSLSGSLSGAQYSLGQNPLDPKEEPYRTFAITFTGVRITAQ